MNCNAPNCNATAIHLCGEYWFCGKCGPHSVGCRCSYCRPVPVTPQVAPLSVDRSPRHFKR